MSLLPGRSAHGLAIALSDLLPAAAMLALLAQFGAKDAELLVLRHEVACYGASSPDRASTGRTGRCWLGWCDCCPRRAWRGLLVEPATVLHWHRDLVRRRWTYSTGSVVRPSPQRCASWCCAWRGSIRPGLSADPWGATPAGTSDRGQHGVGDPAVCGAAVTSMTSATKFR